MSRDILDAAVMQQFKEYLSKKFLVLENLTKDETIKEHKNFINDYYPGAEGSPNEIVESMTSPNPSKALIIYFFDGRSPYTVSSLSWGFNRPLLNAKSLLLFDLLCIK